MNVTKPIVLDETAQEMIRKLDAIKEAILNGGGGGGSAKIYIGTLDEIDQAIASGALNNGDSAKATDDFDDDYIGNRADIASIGNGRICGAIKANNNDIAELNGVGINEVKGVLGNASTQTFITLPSGYTHSNTYILSVMGAYGGSWYNMLTRDGFACDINRDNNLVIWNTEAIFANQNIRILIAKK